MMKTMSVKAPQQCKPMPRSQSRPCSDITWNANDYGFLFKVENTRGVVLMVIYMYVYDPIRTRTLLLTLGALYVIMHWTQGQRTHVPTDALWLFKMKNENTSDEKLSRLSQAKEKDLMTTLVRPPCSARFATRSKLWLFLDKCLVRIIWVWYPQIAKLWKNLARNKYKQNWIIFNPIWTLADAPTCLWVRK